jgi:hypothetical protein
MTHHLHTRTHSAITQLLVNASQHMMEETAHVVTYLDSPIKAAVVGIIAIATHKATHTAH